MTAAIVWYLVGLLTVPAFVVGYGLGFVAELIAAELRLTRTIRQLRATIETINVNMKDKDV